MKRALFVLTCVLGLQLASGCTLGRIYSTAGSDIALTTVEKGASRPFKITKRYVFDYTMAMDVQELVRESFGTPGVLAQNVTIKVRLDPLDVLINFLTVGTALSHTFEATGDVVELPQSRRG